MLISRIVLFVGIIEAAVINRAQININSATKDLRGEVKAPTQENLAELGAEFHEAWKRCSEKTSTLIGRARLLPGEGYDPMAWDNFEWIRAG